MSTLETALAVAFIVALLALSMCFVAMTIAIIREMRG